MRLWSCLLILIVATCTCVHAQPSDTTARPRYMRETLQVVAGVTVARQLQPVARDEIKSGDLIFQTSTSSQSKAIQVATKSKYSHCGLIYKEGNDYYVYEAIQPVKRTVLAAWIARGKDKKYVIKRLRNADQILTPAVLVKMKAASDQLEGKDYDLTFEWTDDRMYCSELIWKVYKQATGIELGKLQQLKDFDLTNEEIKKKIRERYGDKIPLNEPVISPAAIFNSDLLITIKSN